MVLNLLHQCDVIAFIYCCFKKLVPWQDVEKHVTASFHTNVVRWFFAFCSFKFLDFVLKNVVSLQYFLILAPLNFTPSTKCAPQLSSLPRSWIKHSAFFSSEKTWHEMEKSQFMAFALQNEFSSSWGKKYIVKDLKVWNWGIPKAFAQG